MNETFFVDNIKCHGCANSIQKKLRELEKINAVVVKIEEGAIDVQSNEKIDRTVILSKLAKMGYPEKGTSNTMQKAKSFVSCAIGRIS